MKRCFAFVFLFLVAVSAGIANPATTMQPTSSSIRNAAKLLEFQELPCPPKEGADVWRQAVEDKALKRDHRLAAFSYFILRHGAGKTLDELKKVAGVVGIKDSEWKRVARLGGYLPIRKLDLGAGVYRLRLELKGKVVVSITVQLRSDGATLRESAAVVFDGNDVRRVLHSCE